MRTFLYFLNGIMKLYIIILHHALNLDVLDVQNIRKVLENVRQIAIISRYNKKLLKRL